MAQPQKYERQHDFEEDDDAAVNCTALNREFDNAAQTISQLRARQAKILRDDDTLSAGIVGVESLTEEAADFLTRSVDKKTEAALVAASEAGDSAEKADQYASNASQILEEVKSAQARFLAAGQTQLDEIHRIAADGTVASIKAVGADLIGELTSGDMDYGYIADESEGVAASASSAIEACAENMGNIKIAATAGAQAATYAMDAKAWAVSEESPDGTDDADSSTGKTQSAKTWALAAKASAEKAASITPESYTTVEVFNSFMTSIYEACDEFIKGV